ncbi:MAG: DUF4169 family protein [Alphaproteobacteria bacterium]|jgi:hypothetical protein|nr:DUF4169 family protein [Alphaproteobacteria bacterium]
MSVVNLGKHRKTKARAEKKARADANVVKHGRTKAQKLLDTARDEKARRHLDQHKFEDE